MYVKKKFVWMIKIFCFGIPEEYVVIKQNSVIKIILNFFSFIDLQSDEVKTSSQTLDVEKSLFKGPKIQELVQFRKLIEKGDIENTRATVWSNPRYLISGADTPVILHVRWRMSLIELTVACRFILHF